MYKLIVVTPYNMSETFKCKLSSFMNEETIMRRLSEIKESKIKKLISDSVGIHSHVHVIERDTMSKVRIEIDCKLLMYEKKVSVGHIYKNDEYLEKF